MVVVTGVSVVVEVVVEAADLVVEVEVGFVVVVVVVVVVDVVVGFVAVVTGTDVSIIVPSSMSAKLYPHFFAYSCAFESL